METNGFTVEDELVSARSLTLDMLAWEQLILLVLKLTGIVDWSWAVIVAPVAGFAAIVAAVVVAATLAAIND